MALQLLRLAIWIFSILPLTSGQNTSTNRKLINTAPITPNVFLLHKVFNTDAFDELPDQTAVAKAISFGWDKQINSENPAPYLLCTDAGRAGVKEASKYLNTSAIVPFYAKGKTTCLIVTSQARHILKAASSASPIRYASPLPVVLKFGKGLFQTVVSGNYLSDPQACGTGIRAIFSPGTEEDANLEDIPSTLKSDLTTGAFKTTISRGFFWATDYSTLPTAVEFGRRKRRTLVDVGMQEPPQRGKKWMEVLRPVLDGTYGCDFSSLNISITESYLMINDTCSLSRHAAPEASACMLAALAYIASYDNVLYVESIPDFKTNNDKASWIIQSGIPNSYSLWDRGINGEGQVIQVSTTICMRMNPYHEIQPLKKKISFS